ncbi:site-specific integrase [uncultured Nocardioides sp.]|uniref:site-specific integrase n=1 Tax=uncultured Nocardioides sp. TaxID=198441 RepID=UPI0030FA97CD
MESDEAGDGASPQLAQRLAEARLRAFLQGDTTPAESKGELDRLLDRVAEVYAHAVAPSTRATYARRWAHFERWCLTHDAVALPCEPETAMLYLVEAGSAGMSLSTLRGWLAAIARVHVEAGYASPTEDAAMGLFLKGLSRLAPARERPEPISALRIGGLREVCEAIDAGAVDAVEVRDRAVLALHAAGLGDGEVSRLEWGQVRFTARQVHITAPSTGTGPPGRQVVLRPSSRIGSCPVAAVREWRVVSGQDVDPATPVFCLVDGGTRTTEPLKPKRVFSIRKSRLDSLGREGKRARPADAMRLLGQQPSLDLRDRAILLVGFAGAFRRNEVTGLNWSDVRVRDAGLVIRLRRSKTDSEGRGRDVGIPYGKSALTCPVRAFLAWQERVDTQLGGVEPEGSVFVHVGRAGRITSTPMTPEALTRMVRRRAEAAGLEGRWGGRSLRAGFISTAADLDVPLEAIATQSRHATLDSLILYVRREDPFRRNPATRVGL